MSSLALVQVPSDEEAGARLILTAFGMRREAAWRPRRTGGEGEGLALHGLLRIRTPGQKCKKSG